MKRLLKWTVGLVLIGMTIWYFGLKKEHYLISFTTKQPLGVVHKHISNWPNYNANPELAISNVSSQKFSQLDQQITISDSVFLYEWDLKKVENGKTKVTARITDQENKWAQKLQIPFTKNDFVKRGIANVQTVGEALRIEGEKFKVHSITDTLVAPQYCAYLPVTSTIKQKASSMLATIAPIMEYIKSNDIELKGNPFLEVIDWDEAKDEIQYNFCFPIAHSDSIPKNKAIFFKTIEPFRALKAEFNGNYRISDNAWYYLLDYAKQHDFKIKKLPFEIYLNDPHVGGNPLEWKALIFLPLED